MKQMPDPQQKALILTRTAYFDVDKLGAALALGKLLSNSGMSVDIFIGKSFPTQQLTRIFDREQVELIDSIDTTQYSLSLEKGDMEIKDIKWEQTADQVRLLIYTDDGLLDTENLEVIVGGGNYSHIYALGIKTQQDVLNLLGENTSLWEQAETYNIDIRTENDSYAKHNVIIQSRSFAEAVQVYAQQQELAISAEIATDLLSCIYWKTNSLRNKYTTADSFDKVRKLRSQGGSIDLASRRVFASVSFIELIAEQEILGNLDLDKNGIAISYISATTAKQLATVTPVFPDKNPLYKLADSIASFILIPVTQKQTLVLTSFDREQINVKKLFGAYNYVGDPLQAELSFPSSLDETREIISEILFEHFSATDGHQLEEVIPQGSKSNVIVESKLPETRTLPSAQTKDDSSIAEPEIQAEPLVPAKAVELLEEDEEDSDVDPFAGMLPDFPPQNSDPLPSAKISSK